VYFAHITAIRNAGCIALILVGLALTLALLTIGIAGGLPHFD